MVVAVAAAAAAAVAEVVAAVVVAMASRVSTLHRGRLPHSETPALGCWSCSQS